MTELIAVFHTSVVYQTHRLGLTVRQYVASVI
jgi:hypothetical protein